MAETSSALNWCVVRLGEDMNWWVTETSDPIHWDTDALSILDPKQVSYLTDLCEPLIEYGFDPDTFDNAFYTFKIDKEVKDGYIRLTRLRDSVLGSSEMLFGLPDILNEDKSPYAELVDELVRSRVKFLNETIDFEQPLTADDLEEYLADKAGLDYSEGRALHVFSELLAILEYVPEGYEDEVEDEHPAAKDEAAGIEGIPDLEEDEDMEADETMKWDDGDEDEDSDDDEQDEDEDSDEDDEDEEDEKPRRTKKPKKR